MARKKKSAKIHFVLVGANGVGKYSLREQFLKGWIPPKDFQAPPGPSSKAITLEKQTFDVTVSIVRELKSDDEDLKKCHGIVLLYSLSDSNSLQYIKNEAAPFLRSSQNGQTDTEESPAQNLGDRPVVLVANKADEAKLSRQVSETDGKKLSDELNCCGFFETSATCNENVRKAFDSLMTAVMETLPQDGLSKDKGKKKCIIL